MTYEEFAAVCRNWGFVFSSDNKYGLATHEIYWDCPIDGKRFWIAWSSTDIFFWNYANRHGFKNDPSFNRRQLTDGLKKVWYAATKKSANNFIKEMERCDPPA